MKRPLVILTGPTAVGKTSLSLSLAKELDGEIVSADSMQVYRYMDIGTAKIREEERQGIPHHLIDVLDPWEDFNVVRFQKMAREALEEIWERGHIPIVTGGTGFYIQALLYDIHFTENNEDSSLRKDLENYARENGAEALHSRLVEVDEKAASQIHFNNVKRVIRALEFYYQTGKKMSEHNEEERKRTSPYDFKYFVLNDEREHLYAGINRRVDLMMEEGLVEEVRKLKEMGCDSAMVSMQGLGYKEILSHLEGEYTLDEAVYKIKRDTRHFAKRQITWFKRERDVIWLHKPDYDYDETKIREAVLSYYI
ncbi:tRNA dimethylallyltransferase [Claveliimonas bilis]|uniref:tRNA (adenosine(37)-N6)-dimethylallyltransferase MiaA n=1 Tax=Claveliimonas TaxID=3076670 RepID=UPI001E3993FE|nr:tRNA (adenosine(37)-N6)-dimethylallyltransferase MiaA [Claveliimonas bilis]BCZ28734.1 tRNA dimethylallyltransferase [Claveliimonas bilis]BDZ81613.1 tRNA dimethylallyltransferase [Claveliimonas bilis]